MIIKYNREINRVFANLQHGRHIYCKSTGCDTIRGAQLTRSDHEQAQLTRSGYESVLDMPNEACNGGVGDIVKARRKGRRRECEHLGVDRPGVQRRMRETNAAIQVGANAEAEFGGDGRWAYSGLELALKDAGLSFDSAIC
nr:hypothetical protein Iba_chr14bCG1430 [Ipomoea batatas]